MESFGRESDSMEQRTAVFYYKQLSNTMSFYNVYVLF